MVVMAVADKSDNESSEDETECECDDQYVKSGADTKKKKHSE